MSFDLMSSIADIYDDATKYTATVPGTTSKSGDEDYWSVDSTFSQLRDEFKSGQDMDISIDTSGVDKGSVSIIVLNGAGEDGYSAQAAKVLTDNG